MKRVSTHVVSRRGEASARALAGTIRAARQARGLSQADLAERARISLPTLNRMEHGHSGTALWAWLGVMEVLGLLHVFDDLRDPATEALARASLDKPVRRRKPRADMDF
jgi:transcriptional regulator with XRE-family HTH domain